MTDVTTAPFARRSARENDRALRTQELFATLADLDEPGRRAALDEIVELNVPVADRVAGRFARRGIPVEDLRQVAYLALVRAARAFDTTRPGAEFLGYAVPCMRGEVRKYFRDHGWMVRPTRRIQELQAKAGAVVEELTAELGRFPAPGEVATRIEAPTTDVVEAMAADGCFAPSSLDMPVGQDGGASIGELLPDDEAGMAQAEIRAAMMPLLRKMRERDRTIVALRFWEGLSQREVGARLGLSQMQVSRHLARILRELRAGLSELDALPA